MKYDSSFSCWGVQITAESGLIFFSIQKFDLHVQIEIFREFTFIL